MTTKTTVRLPETNTDVHLSVGEHTAVLNYRDYRLTVVVIGGGCVSMTSVRLRQGEDIKFSKSFVVPAAPAVMLETQSLLNLLSCLLEDVTDHGPLTSDEEHVRYEEVS